LPSRSPEIGLSMCLPDMAMSTGIRVSYAIESEEWKRTAAMRWASDVFPVNDCFYGRVSFRIGDQEVLGTGQFEMSVADLAVGLAHIVGELRTGANGTFAFQQSDDMLEISFQADRDSVTISHNLDPGHRWTCDREALENALIDFVVSFTHEAARIVPELFRWRDMEILRHFSTEHAEVKY
jgi:hypothetical protein